MHFGPHFGMFQHSAGKDLVDQLKFAADQGFSGWEDNDMKNRSVADQERIAKAMTQLDMRMGVISALRGTWNNITFAGGEPMPATSCSSKCATSSTSPNAPTPLSSPLSPAGRTPSSRTKKRPLPASSS